MDQQLPFPHRTNQLLSEYSTFGIGGPARYFTEVSTCEAMERLFAYLAHHPMPVHVLGKGSNTLFNDRGFNGLVILNNIDFLTHKENHFLVGSGYSFSQLGTLSARAGWGGLAFAAGIPGTVGGAVYMNAGAHGSTTADVVTEVGYVTEQGVSISLMRSELDFGYRSSFFQQRRGAIVYAAFSLFPAPMAKEEQKQWIYYRMKTQPYKEKSAGSVFRNPPGDSAGRLIEQAGCKAKEVGGARVSPLHANFIVNSGGATAQDVRDLMGAIQESVYQKSGILLTPELCCVPYEF